MTGVKSERIRSLGLRTSGKCKEKANQDMHAVVVSSTEDQKIPWFAAGKMLTFFAPLELELNGTFSGVEEILGQRRFGFKGCYLETLLNKL